MKNLSDLILLQFSVLMRTQNESPAVMQYYICCCFGKFRILNLFTGLPAESHWWEDEIVWRRALFKMKFSINNKQKQPLQKDKICYVMEAPPVPLLCTRRVLNRVHIILLWNLPFLLHIYTLYFLPPFHKRKILLCWGIWDLLRNYKALWRNSYFRKNWLPHPHPCPTNSCCHPGLHLPPSHLPASLLNSILPGQCGLISHLSSVVPRLIIWSQLQGPVAD